MPFCVICSSCTCSHVGSKRAGSMYGGAGGFGVRISQATSTHGIDSIIDNKKATMQDLNYRLETYLETVGNLKKTNAELELKINQFLEQRVGHETNNACTAFIVKIHTLQAQISNAVLHNTEIQLKNDNVKLESNDWKVKYESELSLRQCVDADIAALTMVQEELAVGRSSVELQDLKDELQRLNVNHKEDMQRHLEKVKLGFQNVNVEVDAAHQDDLAMVLESMRKHYESVVTRERQNVEAWFKTKTTKLNEEVAQRTDNLDSLKSQIIGFRQTLCNLEIDYQAEISKKACQVKVLEETKCRFASLLAGFQRQVRILEEQLTLLRDDMTKHAQDKTKLEVDIIEYRRLLRGTDSTGKTKTTTTDNTTEVKYQKTEEVISSKSNKTSFTELHIE